MNRFTAILLRRVGVGRGRPAPKSGFGRFVRRSERTLGILLLLYAGLQFHPQVVFAHSVTANGMTFHSRSPLPPETALCAQRVAELIRQSELAVPGRHEHVFICNSPSWFRFFNPRSSGAFAASVSLTNHVFMTDADFSADVVRSTAPNYNSRLLSSVVAHEITHGLIRHRLGLWGTLRLPSWVEEGYCELVAQDSSFPEAHGFSLMAEGKYHPSGAFRYFKYRQMVRYLMEEKGLSFQQLVERADDLAAVEAETRQAIDAGKMR